MDLNKEIKLSDLFKRRANARKETSEVAEPVAKEKDEDGRVSFLKRDISLGRSRKGSAEAKPEQEPKRAKDPRRSRRATKAAAPLPALPLMRAFNLLPKDDPRQKADGRRPSTAQLVLAVVGLLLVAGLASAFLLMNARVADKQKTYDVLRQQVAAKNMPIQEPQQDASDAALVQERQARTSALATALGARVAWDRLLREFSLVLPDDVWLTSITAKGPASTDPAASGQPVPTTAPVSTFEIRGYTNEQDGVARLLARMAVLPELSSVQLVSSTRVELRSKEVVEFSITATVKPTGVGATA